jgi:hypothetical protein
MIWILLAMLLILLCAGVIVLYVAFPHRGEEMPHTPWVGRLMRRGVRKLPTIQQQAAQEQVTQQQAAQERGVQEQAVRQQVPQHRRQDR